MPGMYSMIVPGDLAFLQELEEELLEDEMPGNTPEQPKQGRFLPMVAEGQVYSVSPSISPGGRSMQIKVRTNSGAEYLQDGMFVACTIAVNERQDTVLVPINSLIFRENTAYVFVANPDTGIATRREILMGIESTNYIEVLSGIEEGELIITEGHQRLVDGTRVEIVENAGGQTL
jgi:multidrug efflux pump subunit AcrA (membrane-fusion protein)